MLKTNICAELVPGVSAIISEIGPNYTGVYWTGSNPFFMKESGKYKLRKVLKRIFCSCGYEAASIEDAYHPICPKCGGRLIEMTRESKDNHFAADGYTIQIEGDSIVKYKFDINVMPNFVGASTDESAPENVKTMKIVATKKEACRVEKLADSSYAIHKSHISASRGYWYTSKNVTLNDEILDFFKEDIVFVTGATSYEDAKKNRETINIDLEDSRLMQMSYFPTAFREAIKSEGMFRELTEIVKKSGNLGTNGKKISKNASMEELLTAKGYPVDIFPIGWIGRANLTFGVRDLKSFRKSELGEITFSRILNGENVSANTVNKMYDMYTKVSGKKNAADTTHELFVSFMKDAVDQYGFNESVNLFSNRISVLKNRGIMPDEVNIRTRQFCALINSETYRPKKMVNIEEVIQKDPLEALRSLMVQKD